MFFLLLLFHSLEIKNKEHMHQAQRRLMLRIKTELQLQSQWPHWGSCFLDFGSGGVYLILPLACFSFQSDFVFIN